MPNIISAQLFIGSAPVIYEKGKVHSAGLKQKRMHITSVDERIRSLDFAYIDKTEMNIFNRWCFKEINIFNVDTGKIETICVNIASVAKRLGKSKADAIKELEQVSSNDTLQTSIKDFLKPEKEILVQRMKWGTNKPLQFLKDQIGKVFSTTSPKITAYKAWLEGYFEFTKAEDKESLEVLSTLIAYLEENPTNIPPAIKDLPFYKALDQNLLPRIKTEIQHAYKSTNTSTVQASKPALYSQKHSILSYFESFVKTYNTFEKRAELKRRLDAKLKHLSINDLQKIHGKTDEYLHWIKTTFPFISLAMQNAISLALAIVDHDKNEEFFTENCKERVEKEMLNDERAKIVKNLVSFL